MMRNSLAAKKTARNSGDQKSLARVYAELSGKPMEVKLVVLSDRTQDAPGAQAISDFGARVLSGHRPMCLLCDRVWNDLKDEPPAALVLISTHDFFCDDPNAAKPAILSAVCWDCWEGGNVLVRAKDAYRASLWPYLRDVAEPIERKQ
jgi:hypothetical protein